MFLGCVVDVERKALSGIGIIDNVVRLRKGGATGGLDRAAAGVWSTVETTVAYGSNVDLWGQVLSPADVNSAAFGVSMSVSYSVVAGNDYPQVDRMRVTVHFTCP